MIQLLTEKQNINGEYLPTITLFYRYKYYNFAQYWSPHHMYCKLQYIGVPLHRTCS